MKQKEKSLIFDINITNVFFFRVCSILIFGAFYEISDHLLIIPCGANECRR